MWALTWFVPALDRLAAVYVSLDPDDRERLAAAVEALNARLRADPLAVGESREGANRIAFAHRLVVDFRVDREARTVRVTDARRSGR